MSAGYRLSKARTHAKTGHQAPMPSSSHGKHRKVSQNTLTPNRNATGLPTTQTFSELARQPIISHVPPMHPSMEHTSRSKRLRAASDGTVQGKKV